MKKYMFLFLLLALLSGCATAPQETPTPTETPVPTAAATPEPAPTDTDPEIYAEVPISLLDLSSYEGELSNEEWEALRGFFPVLNNEVPMLAAPLSTEAEGVTPTEEVFFRDIYEAYDPESGLPPSRYLAMSFSLAPVVGEELDLVLVMNSFNGWHLLIHREGERFYAVYIPFRWFKSLQTDGLYLGSGGAATSYYYRLHFSNGTFTEELLANTDWGEQNEDGSYSGYYAIGGTEVTQAEFDAWLENVFFTEDAVWRPARAKSLEPWQEAYIEFLQPENRKSRTAAREAERDYSSVEEYYGLYDVDGDKIPELAICFWEFGRYYIDLYAYSDHEIRFLDSFCAGRNGPYIFICPGEAAFLTELVLYGPGGTSYGWRKFTLLDNVFKQEDLIECEIIPWDDADEPSPDGVPAKATDLVPNAQPLELIDIENIQKILLYVEGEEGSR